MVGRRPVGYADRRLPIPGWFSVRRLEAGYGSLLAGTGADVESCREQFGRIQDHHDRLLPS